MTAAESRKKAARAALRTEKGQGLIRMLFQSTITQRYTVEGRQRVRVYGTTAVKGVNYEH